MRTPDRLDSLLWAIAARGPEAAFEHATQIRALARKEFTSFMAVREALESEGMARADVMELVLGRHATDCACWRCVMRTDMQVRKHLAQMAGKMAYRTAYGDFHGEAENDGGGTDGSAKHPNARRGASDAGVR